MQCGSDRMVYGWALQGTPMNCLPSKPTRSGWRTHPHSRAVDTAGSADAQECGGARLWQKKPQKNSGRGMNRTTGMRPWARANKKTNHRIATKSSNRLPSSKCTGQVWGSVAPPWKSRCPRGRAVKRLTSRATRTRPTSGARQGASMESRRRMIVGNVISHAQYGKWLLGLLGPVFRPLSRGRCPR